MVISYSGHLITVQRMHEFPRKFRSRTPETCTYFDRVDLVGWVKIRETADAPWRALEPRELVPEHALRLLPPLRRRLGTS